MIELLNEDCMDVMARYPDNYFDLAITDPPYGIGTSLMKNMKNKSKLAKSKDYKAYGNNHNDRPSREYFSELFRVSRNQIIWGANHLCDLFDAKSGAWIVWDKLTGEVSFADCELAYTSFPGTVSKFTFMWAGMRQGDPADGSKMQGNKKLNELRIHPSQKPVQLYKMMMEKYAVAGQRILDTHLGSGSSAIAAHSFGCDFVGTEKDEHHYQAASKRVDQMTKQKAMF